MARGSQERELEFVENAKQTTGRTVPEWMAVLETSDVEAKPNSLLNYLKGEHGLNHLQANYLSGIYLNNGKPVFNYETLYRKLFDGKTAQWQPLFQSLERMLHDQFDDVLCVPTKTYISIEGDKIFGCAKLTQKAIRYGLDLGDEPFEGRVQKAKGLGAMPNITHMVELTDEADLDDELLTLTQKAFHRLHA